MNLTHLVGQVKTDTGQVTVDTGRCDGDPVRGYVRIFARNPLFPESGQYIFLTIEQVRALEYILDGWLEAEEGLPPEYVNPADANKTWPQPRKTEN